MIRLLQVNQDKGLIWINSNQLRHSGHSGQQYKALPPPAPPPPPSATQANQIDGKQFTKSVEPRILQAH
ncbi:unnamed protein product [Schistocephalus solidus]|uniref:Uncharacterized protein n=1 Tax=Schistocephalus solidus TaxID=70667 RepID=A0A183SGJ3_SCHSO|nr:unnamed protein product [Schistocephalus solidus]